MKRMLSNYELMTFFDQLSLILKSGISSLEGISIMKEDADTKEGQELLNQIYEQLEMTGYLHESLSASEVFPDYALAMIDLGERTGCLDEVSLSLRDYYERELNISSSIKTAVTYPLIMLGMMVAVVAVLMMKVMPVFEQVFAQLGISLSGFAAGIFRLGQTFSSYALVFLVILLVLILVGFYFLRSAKGREALSDFVKKCGLTKGLSEKISRSRFASGMSMVLKSGMDTEEGLDMMKKILDHPDFEQKLDKAKAIIAEGNSFSKAMVQAGIFSGLYSQMISIGYRTGCLDEVMNRISQQYEMEINDQLQHTVGILEPTMVAALSLVIGLILLSIMVPLIGIMSSIG